MFSFDVMLLVKEGVYFSIQQFQFLLEEEMSDGLRTDAV